VTTREDLAGPVSVSYGKHDNLNILCLYAVHSTGFECENGKFHCSAEDVARLQRQFDVDQRCLKFGKFAVIVPAVPFLNQLRAALSMQGYSFIGKLVQYYDERTFHGTIPEKEIPFKKQRRFDYQREFRICVQPRILTAGPITISIGDISKISAKVESSQIPRLFQLKPDAS
jgi:hypothetical protein